MDRSVVEEKKMQMERRRKEEREEKKGRWAREEEEWGWDTAREVMKNKTTARREIAKVDAGEGGLEEEKGFSLLFRGGSQLGHDKVEDREWERVSCSRYVSCLKREREW
jgi:hypothetical protein